MLKKVAVSQSNYIPWRGYFDLINYVDEFIIFDDMQYTKRDWRNRNIIKTSNGLIWLTIPVNVKGKFNQKINNTEIADNSWQKNHLKSIQVNYSKSKYFDIIMPLLENLYKKQNFNNLSSCNIEFIKLINNFLNIKTKISNSSDFFLESDKNERLTSLVEQTCGKIYVSGPAGQNYINIDFFRKKNISVEWFDYDNYKRYDQLWGDFENNVSIIDLLMNEGFNATNFLKSNIKKILR